MVVQDRVVHFWALPEYIFFKIDAYPGSILDHRRVHYFSILDHRRVHYVNVLCDGPGSKKMYSGMVLDGSKMYSNGGPGVFCEYGPPPDPGPSPGTFPTQSRQLYVHSFLSSKQVLLIFQVFLLCF